MLLKKKRKALIDWFNCVLILDGPLESVQQLSDGRHFRRLVSLIDSTTEDLPDDADVYNFIMEFLNGYFHSGVGAFINTAACSQGDEFELAKMSLLLLSAVVQHSLSRENNFLNNLTELDPNTQEDIRDCIQAVILPNGDRLSAEFSDVLSKKKFMNAESPILQTPRRSTRRTTVLSPKSPLVSFLDSPMFTRQAAIKNLESRVRTLQHQLNAKDDKFMELEAEKDRFKKLIQEHVTEIKALKEKNGELITHMDTEEESSRSSVEQYKTEIESLRNQIREAQNIQLESSRLQNENVELRNFNNNLQSKLEDFEMMKTKLHTLGTDLHQAKAIVESQKAAIEEIQIENNSLKRRVDERENDVKIMKSLYDDAMQENRKLQNSPDLPKGESMKVVIEMEMADLQKNIRVLEEREVELKDHLKSSTVHNETLKKDVAVAVEKLNETEGVIQLKDKELSGLYSSITVLTNEKHTLQENLQVQEQKVNSLMVEMDLLKEQSQQQFVQYEQNKVKLEGKLCDLNSKLKTFSDSEKQSVIALNQSESQRDALSRELEQTTAKLNETEDKLKTLVESKEMEVSQLNSSITALKEENHCLQGTLSRELEQTTAKLSEAENRLKSLAESKEMEVSQLNSSITALKEENHCLQDTLSRKLEQTAAKLSEAENRLKSLAESKEMEVSQLNSSITALKKENHCLQDALSRELEQTTAKLVEAENRLKSLVESKEMEMSQLNSSIAALREENRCLGEKNFKLNDENAHLKEAEEITSKTRNSEMEHLKMQSKQQHLEDEEKRRKLEAELSDTSSKLKFHLEKGECDGSSLNQAILEKNAVSEELTVLKEKYDELELEFSRHVEHCKNGKVAENLRAALDRLAVENSVLQKQLDAFKAEQHEMVEKVTNNKQNLDTSNVQKKEMEENIERLFKQVQDLQKLCDQKDEKIKELEDLLQNLKELSSSTESKHLIQVNDLNHCIEEKNVCIEKANEEMEKFKTIAESKANELKTVENSLREINTLYSELLKEVSDLKLEKLKLEETAHHFNQESNSTIKNLENTIGELKNDNDNLRLSLYSSDSENRKLLDKLEETKKSVNSLMENNRQKDEVIDRLSQRIQSLEEAQTQFGVDHNADVKRIQEENKAVVSHYSLKVQNLECSVAEKERDLEKARKEIQELESKSKLLHESNIKIESLQATLEILRKESSDLKSSADLKNSEIERLETREKSLLDMTKEKDMCIEKINEEVEKLKKIAESKGDELRTVENSLKEVNTLYSDLLKEVSHLKAEKLKLEETAHHLNHESSNTIKNLENTIAELKKENDQIRLRLYSADSVNHKLIDKLEETNKNVNSLTEKNRQNGEIIDKLSREVQNLEEAQAQLGMNHNAEVKGIQDLLLNSQEENKVLASQVQSLECSIEEKVRDLEKAHEQVQKLESECKLLHESSVKIESLQATLESLRKENSDLKLSVDSENSEFIKRLQSTESSLLDMTEQKRKSDEDIKQLEESKSSLLAEMSALQSEILKGKDRIAHLESETNRLTLYYQEKENELNNLLENTESEKESLKKEVAFKDEKLNEKDAVFRSFSESKEREIHGLRSELEKLEDEHQGAQLNINQQQSKIAEYEELIEMSVKVKHSSESNTHQSIQTDLEVDTLLNQSQKFQSLYEHSKLKEDELNNLWKNAVSEIEGLKKEIAIKDEKLNEIDSLIKNFRESEEKGFPEHLSALTRLTEEHRNFQLQIKEHERVKTRLEEQLSEMNAGQSSETDVELDRLKEFQTLYEKEKQSHLEHLKTCATDRDAVEGLKALVEKLVCEKDDMQKHIESLDISKQELMGKLQDTERRHDNLTKQKEIAELDFSRCVDKRDEDIERLRKQIQELEFQSRSESLKLKLEEVQDLQQASKQSESKLLAEIHNLKQCVQQKEKLVEKMYKNSQQLEDVIKLKDESCVKMKNSMKETEAETHKLLTEISCLNEEKKIDKERIDKLTSESKRLSSYNQQQKKMIEEMKEVQQKLLDSDGENRAVQQKFLEQKKRNDLRMESMKKTVSKLENEKAELEKRLLSFKQKLIGYQNVSESYKQALAQERKQLKSAKEELGSLQKRINQMEQTVQNYKQQKSCLEGEIRRTRAELDEMRSKYDLDAHRPVARRFSSSTTPVHTPSRKLRTSLGDADEEALSPIVWKKPAVRRRMSNASSLASCFSLSNETLNGPLDVTPARAAGAANLFLPLADEEDFLNYSSLAELKSGPRSVTKSSTKRLSELQRRNTLCPPHMRSSYPVETQMRPVCEFSDDSLKGGHAVQDKSVLAEKRQDANKVLSPKRKRSSSEESGHVKVKKVSKKTEIWESFKQSVVTSMSPRPGVSRTPTALKNIFVRKRGQVDVSKRMKAKRF